MMRRLDPIGRLWMERRVELAVERKRNGLDLGQAMREYERTQTERGDIPHDRNERLRLERIKKLRKRAAAHKNGDAKPLRGWRAQDRMFLRTASA
jgi:hypothetical protein